METAPERIEPPIGTRAAPDSHELNPRTTSSIGTGQQSWRATAAGRRDRLAAELRRLRPVLIAYGATWLLLLGVAALDALLRHHSFPKELTNWDGHWYKDLTEHGYPHEPLHTRSTLGFFPLYPLVTWAVAHLFTVTPAVGGVIVAAVGGLVATVLVERLASGWWGREAGRRAAILFCLFPGSVVFVMVYSEGLLLPLVAGAILALQRRRWVLAGVLAGFATAVGPAATTIILTCLVSALLHLRREGWRNRAAWRAAWAPVLSATGLAAFAIFLWAWTGTPFASLHAQHYGWGEKTDPLALVRQAHWLQTQISFSHFNHPTINLNLVLGTAGAIFMVIGLIFLFRRPRRVSIEGLVWTLGVAFLASTSEYTPPNPRLLITAFPVVIVFARYLKGRRFVILAAGYGFWLVVLSSLTFIGVTLRP